MRYISQLQAKSRTLFPSLPFDQVAAHINYTVVPPIIGCVRHVDAMRQLKANYPFEEESVKHAIQLARNSNGALAFMTYEFAAGTNALFKYTLFGPPSAAEIARDGARRRNSGFRRSAFRDSETDGRLLEANWDMIDELIAQAELTTDALLLEDAASFVRSRVVAVLERMIADNERNRGTA